jgi:hypothetical protein
MTLRSWPWTLALAGIVTGFLLLGLIGLSLRTSVAEVVISSVACLAALAALSRVLSMGVRVTASGLVVRELTRTTLVAWTQVRRVTSEPTGRRSIHAPVLTLAQGRTELTILASYRAEVSQHRAAALERARVAATPAPRRKR